MAMGTFLGFKQTYEVVREDVSHRDDAAFKQEKYNLTCYTPYELPPSVMVGSSVRRFVIIF